MTNVYKTLVAARKKIDSPEKWGKGIRAFKRPQLRGLDTCCASEAIEDVTKINWDKATITADDDKIIFTRKAAYHLIECCAGISNHGDYSEESIPGWNDAPETTYDDVIHVYDLAIAIVRDFAK